MNKLVFTCVIYLSFYTSVYSFNPVLKVIPNIRNHDFIWYQQQNKSSIEVYIQEIFNKLEEYKIPITNEPNIQQCDFDKPRESDKVICSIDVYKFGPCSRQQYYGFERFELCFFLRIDNVKNWVPQFYNNITDLPDTMPVNLKNHITHLPENQRNQIWISCDGTNSADKENVKGLEYFPRPGFPGFYYPVENVYQAPLVAVKIKSPTIGLVISITCQMWTKNQNSNVSIDVLIDF